MVENKVNNFFLKKIIVIFILFFYFSSQKSAVERERKKDIEHVQKVLIITEVIISADMNDEMRDEYFKKNKYDFQVVSDIKIQLEIFDQKKELLTRYKNSKIWEILEEIEKIDPLAVIKQIILNQYPEIKEKSLSSMVEILSNTKTNDKKKYDSLITILDLENNLSKEIEREEVKKPKQEEIEKETIETDEKNQKELRNTKINSIIQESNKIIDISKNIKKIICKTYPYLEAHKNKEKIISLLLPILMTIREGLKKTEELELSKKNSFYLNKKNSFTQEKNQWIKQYIDLENKSGITDKKRIIINYLKEEKIKINAENIKKAIDELHLDSDLNNNLFINNILEEYSQPETEEEKIEIQKTIDL